MRCRNPRDHAEPSESAKALSPSSRRSPRPNSRIHCDLFFPLRNNRRWASSWRRKRLSEQDPRQRSSTNLPRRCGGRWARSMSAKPDPHCSAERGRTSNAAPPFAHRTRVLLRSLHRCDCCRRPRTRRRRHLPQLLAERSPHTQMRRQADFSIPRAASRFRLLQNSCKAFQSRRRARSTACRWSQ